MGTKYIPVILLICSFCCTGLLKAQDKGIYDTVRVYAYITPEGDTIGESWLPSVEVIGKLNAAGRKYWAEWTRFHGLHLDQRGELSIQLDREVAETSSPAHLRPSLHYAIVDEVDDPMRGGAAR